MGETLGDDNRIFIGNDGSYVTLSSIVKGLLSNDNKGVTKQDFSFLDLGKELSFLLQRFPLTIGFPGSGRVLCQLHRKFGFAYSQLLGVSALDHRSHCDENDELPGTSYMVANIDTLLCKDKLDGQDGKKEINDKCIENKCGITPKSKFALVWSRHTFYHLVDPVAAVEMAMNLTCPGGCALLFHVPIRAQGLDPKLLKDFHIDRSKTVEFSCVEEMIDKPGNFMILIFDGNKCATTFKDLTYKNKLISAAGTYTYATYDSPGKTIEKKMFKCDSYSKVFFKRLAIIISAVNEKSHREKKKRARLNLRNICFCIRT
eukprot:CAMPEP_0114538408 /NCGR_PEP_ID=MMETSP0109-20121206/30124_1 /TAXON_ID=29199 /ORGANISM="Chlorarachnion reptans, Strain CCCM449" /LENGTH=315 /DNA_ID=CAMNT_0001722419 /DNA_START=169 /DNA_END=1117 /DNA_ORIENTATION=-